MNTINRILQEITNYKYGELCIFCGAGISINSGLPIVCTFLDYALSKLEIVDADKEELIKGDLAFPFETFMEIFLENSHDENILDVFGEGNINNNHLLISELAIRKIIKNIYTTNFDCLIEKALYKKGLLQNQDFEVFYKESDFVEKNFNTQKDTLKVFKIHGSHHDKKSIRTTLKSVSNKIQSFNRRNLINDIFSTSVNRSILILGYSCSDFFDIIPTIESITDSKVKIYFVEHDSQIKTKNNCIIENISKKGSNNPFKKFDGHRIIVNTDSFVRWLYNEFNIEYYLIKKDPQIAPQYIDNWIKNFGTQHISYTILGQLFYRIPDIEKSHYYYNKALEIDRKNKDRIKEAGILNNIGLLYQDQFEYDEALKYYHQALYIYEDKDNTRGIAIACSNLGFAYAYKDWGKSYMYCKRAIKKAKEIDADFIKANALNNIGLMHKNKKEYKKALKYYNKVLEIDNETGDKAGESTTLTNIGNVYKSDNNNDEAIKYYLEALQITERIGYKLGESYILHNIAESYKNLNEINKYNIFKERAESIDKDFNFSFSEFQIA